MGILYATWVLIIILLYVNVWILYELFEQRAAIRWWMLLLLVWGVGTACGVYGGFFFEYQASPTVRVIGAPIPGGIFHLEGPPGQEQWVDYIVPFPWLNILTNMALLPLLAGCVHGLLFWRLGRRRKPPMGENIDQR